MDFLDLREPVSALSHGTGLLLAVPATVLLWNRSRAERTKQFSLLVFGLSLASCYGASSLFHGVRVPREELVTFYLLDHFGIFLLIAGTYTPIACNLLDGHWRRVTLLLAWLSAAAGGALHLACGELPPWISTVLYLAIGWGAVFCYFKMAQRLTHRPLRPLLVGGVLYSLGAVLNLLHWPVLWPGVFEAHELFHLFVMAGSLAHFWFMLKVVLPSTSGMVGQELIQPRPTSIFLPAFQRRRKRAFTRTVRSPSASA